MSVKEMKKLSQGLIKGFAIGQEQDSPCKRP